MLDCISRSDPALDELDRKLILATQDGLPLTARPYDLIGDRIGLSGAEVQRRLQSMLASGRIRRIAAVPNHYALGYLANGMTVWDIPDAQVDACGETIGRLPNVSHCYRRPRHLPLWHYNLFAMLHGRTREEVITQAEQIAILLTPHVQDYQVLFSTAILKKTGLRLRAQEG
jgi:DNA-binding Lrp family transcriptional regulator